MNNREVLAISSSIRSVGVCLPIGTNYLAGTEVSIPMLAFSSILIPMNMAFALVAGRMRPGGRRQQSAQGVKGREERVTIAKSEGR